MDYGTPTLVVDCGTCITFTSSSERGFGIRAGGILPGIQTQFDSMSEHTAALPRIVINDEIKRMSNEKNSRIELFVKGNKTKEAMIAGVVVGSCAVVREAIAQWCKEMKKDNKVSGGLGGREW